MDAFDMAFLSLLETMEETKQPEQEVLTPAITQRTQDRIAEAKEAAALLKAENDRKERLLEEERALHAEEILSGSTKAGQVEKPKVETNKEYRERVEREMAKSKYDQE